MKWLGKIYGELVGILLVLLVLMILKWEEAMIWLALQPDWFLPAVSAVVIIPAAITIIKDKGLMKSREWSAFAMLCWLIGGVLIWGALLYQSGDYMTSYEMRRNQYLASKGLIDPNEQPENLTNNIAEYDGGEMCPGAYDQEASSSPCTAKPCHTEIGSEAWPVSEEYLGMGYLGQLLTASDCSKARISEVMSGAKYYRWGVWLSLYQPPSDGLMEVFNDLGFQPAEIGEGDNQEDSKATDWILTSDKVLVTKILRLKEFAKEIRYSDCVHCG